jgi:hypothetical protein
MLLSAPISPVLAQKPREGAGAAVGLVLPREVRFLLNRERE